VAALDGAFARIDRAEEHLANLKSRVDEYVKPLGGGVEVRVVPGQQPRFPSEPPKLGEIPITFGILIGETVQNLRTALDYLVYELANWRSGPDKSRRTQFPIESKPYGFNGRIDSFLEGVFEDHVAAIKRLQPFDGRRNWLWHIRDISNTDKHNVVPATMGFGEMLIYAGTHATTATLAGGYAKPGDPVGMYFKIPMSIALREGDDPAPQRLPDHRPAIKLLEDLIAQTRGLLETFEPIFETEPPPRVLTHRPATPRKRKKNRRR
jgi:hypothetical protein